MFLAHSYWFIIASFYVFLVVIIYISTFDPMITSKNRSCNKNIFIRNISVKENIVRKETNICKSCKHAFVGIEPAALVAAGRELL